MRKKPVKGDITTNRGNEYNLALPRKAFPCTLHREYYVVWCIEDHQRYIYVWADDVDDYYLWERIRRNRISSKDVSFFICPIEQVIQKEETGWIASLPFGQVEPETRVYTLKEEENHYRYNLPFGLGLARCLAVVEKYGMQVSPERVLWLKDEEGFHFAIDIVSGDADQRGNGVMNVKGMAARYMHEMIRSLDPYAKLPFSNMNMYVSWFEKHLFDLNRPPVRKEPQKVGVRLVKGDMFLDIDIPVLERPVSFTEIRKNSFQLQEKENGWDTTLVFSKTSLGELRVRWKLQGTDSLLYNKHPVSVGEMLPVHLNDVYELRVADKHYRMQVRSLPQEIQGTEQPLYISPSFQNPPPAFCLAETNRATEDKGAWQPFQTMQSTSPVLARDPGKIPKETPDWKPEKQAWDQPAPEMTDLDPEDLYWMTSMLPGGILYTTRKKDNRKVRLILWPETETARLSVLRELRGKASLFENSPVKVENIIEMPGEKGRLLSSVVLPEEELLSAGSGKVRSLTKNEKLVYLKRMANLFDLFQKTGWYPSRLGMDSFKLSIVSGNLMYMTPEYLIPDNRLAAETELGFTVPADYSGEKMMTEQKTAFAMLVWAYYLMVGGFPYDGRASRDYCIRERLTEQAAAPVIYGKESVFVFDSKNNSNRPPQIPWYDQQQERWDALPENLKKVFTEAFTETSGSRLMWAVRELAHTSSFF